MADLNASNTEGLQPATLWSRKNDKGDWEFNHLELGHVQEGTTRPTPKHENHKTAWKRGEWHARLAYLTAELPARVVAG